MLLSYEETIWKKNRLSSCLTYEYIMPISQESGNQQLINMQSKTSKVSEKIQTEIFHQRRTLTKKVQNNFYNNSKSSYTSSNENFRENFRKNFRFICTLMLTRSHCAIDFSASYTTIQRLVLLC